MVVCGVQPTGRFLDKHSECFGYDRSLKLMRRDLDISLIRAFLAVVDADEITAAASALGVSQAAASQQIKRLEEALDAACSSAAAASSRWRRRASGCSPRRAACWR